MANDTRKSVDKTIPENVESIVLAFARVRQSYLQYDYSGTLIPKHDSGKALTRVTNNCRDLEARDF